MPKWVWVCVLAGALGGGCGDAKEPIANQDASIGGTGNTSGDGDGDGDGSSPAGDGDGDGSSPAGDGDGDSIAGDGDGDSVAGDGDGDGVPNDGTHLASCAADGECGDGLACFGDGGDTIGYCAEQCSNDRECTDIEGLLTLCTGGECAIDCSDGVNGSAGQCPTNMACNADQFCTYPVDIAGGDATMWQLCDADRDCGAGSTCEGGSAAGPFTRASKGFCTTGCRADGDCSDDGGAGGTAGCYVMQSMFSTTRYCVVKCSNDRQCPLPLVCNGSGRCVP